MKILLLLGLAGLPDGYLVWVQGEVSDPASRRIVRMTLPDQRDFRVLTTGEDVEAQVSPDGRWVAYAKAKLPGGTDYHDFDRWSLYVVSIEGVDGGARELEVDKSGYWPSWGSDNTLYYSQTDNVDDQDQHTRVMRAVLDQQGDVVERGELLATRTIFGPAGSDPIPELWKIEECFVAPNGSWFAARTRGSDTFEEYGVNAYVVDPASHVRVGWTERRHGCQPYVAPSGDWVYHAGEYEGIKWGDAPHIANRQVNQTLVEPFYPDGVTYFPHVSRDEKWVVAAQSPALDIPDIDQNGGAWDLYIYALTGKSVGQGQLLVSGGYNAWPGIWIPPPAGSDTDPDPAQDPQPDEPSDPVPGADEPSEELADQAIGGSCGNLAYGRSSLAYAAAVLLLWRQRRRRA